MSNDEKNKTVSSSWKFLVDQKKESIEIDSNGDSTVNDDADMDIDVDKLQAPSLSEKKEVSLKIDESTTTLYRISRAKMAEQEEKSNFLKRSAQYTGTYKKHKFKVIDAEIPLRIIAFLVDTIFLFIAFKLINTFHNNYEIFFAKYFTDSLSQFFPLILNDFSPVFSKVPFYGDILNNILPSIYGIDFSLGEACAFIIFFNLMILFYIIPLSWKGKSIGCFFTQIELIHCEQGFLVLDKVFLRQLIVLPLSIMTLIGPLLIFVGPKKRTLHDLIMSSRVIKSPHKG